jgi:formate-dependent phosphoribosylglycinamide formyltransferase (GAR transformylase)
MHVLFVEPAFPANQRQFVRGLHAAGAVVTGIGERPLQYLDGELKGWLHAYEQVGSVVDERALHEAVVRCQRREWVDRLEATVEAHVMPAARVREACGIPGTSERTAFLCRDKPAMKQALREAGVPCAQSMGASSPQEAREFAERVGFPLIVKPRDAAGASGTHKVSNAAELERALDAAGVGHSGSAALEEFIEGHEGFYDTICRGGEVVHEFITHYYPNVLDAMRHRTISPQFIATNRMSAPAYEEVRRLGKQVIEALGIGTSATHMEWFFGPKGLKFSEIGCRPPGVGAWDLYCAGNEMDVYQEWARAIVARPPAQRPSRRFAAGMIALRPDRDGHIAGYDGLDAVKQQYGECLIDSHLPAPGTPTAPIEAGYMANAWLRLRHPDYDALRGILDDVGRSIKVYAR